MEIIRGSYNLKPAHRGCVATFGSFDGVHRGHRQLLVQLVQAARERGVPATVMTTEPLSREFFAPGSAPPRLTRLREKLALLGELGIDRVLVEPFNQKLATLSAEAFVERILVGGLGVRHLVIGDDTRFGHRRRGDFALLETLGRAHGFSVERTATLAAEGERVSSSRVRDALTRGDMQAATELLGRVYHMSGRVAHGDKRGRSLGFPTANIHLNRRRSPLLGIFAVRVAGLAPRPLPGVASVGFRPTFGGGKCVLEVFIFDFDERIYGRHVDVHFHAKLREERRFESTAALVEQMHLDTARARDFFGGSFTLSNEKT